MEFNLAEKLAIVRVLESVIIADGIVHKNELNTLSDLMKRLDFDSNFLVQARAVATNQAILILNEMPDDKKKALASILDEMAMSDGFLHEKEVEVIIKTCTGMGILNR
ncbi:hypothetical protein [Maribacter sp. HTCC2170]|uniref:tellurite resistance TerB family protein n=1 Tax=Maribacter sp. (strain HTCC2170 / KCCM 42371) TaxID=313603 RepID=UPI00006BD27C|nr:hypothetical protein [Maribacter sp. HTCC2170]EAR02476.1 hypothetical protein FB2170_04295 [Maribacter sp. HTCC2170]